MPLNISTLKYAKCIFLNLLQPASLRFATAALTLIAPGQTLVKVLAICWSGITAVQKDRLELAALAFKLFVSKTTVH